MAPPTTKTKEASAIKHRQKFEGHTDSIWSVIYLPGGQRIITCSLDGTLRVWNLESGKQIGEDWRDGDSGVWTIALSPNGKKVVSGSEDGAVRLWDIDTCKVITKWTRHTKRVVSVCWSRDGRRVLSGCDDGIVRQWDVENKETVLATSIKTGHTRVWAVAYSPDATLIATGGRDAPWTGEHAESSVQIWDSKTGEMVANLKGHTREVRCLAWTQTLISGSYDYSIRTWNTKTWKQIAVLEDTSYVMDIAISANDRILVSVSGDKTARFWNLDNGKPIGSSLQHTDEVNCASFSADGKLLATGCNDNNAYIWDVAAVIKEAGLDDLLSNSKAYKSALHADATRRPIQQRPPAYRQGFFDGVPPAHLSARIRHNSSAQPGSTFLSRLFHRSPSDVHDTSPSSPLGWVRNLLKPRRQSGEEIELQGRSPAVVEVPYAKGKRRNASAREKQRMKPLPSKNPTAGSSWPPKPNVQFGTPTQAQPAVSNSSTTPAIADDTTATSSMPSRPDVMLRQAGLWTRFWVFICCLSPEYQPPG